MIASRGLRSVRTIVPVLAFASTMAHAGEPVCLQTTAYRSNAGIVVRKEAGVLSAAARNCLEVLITRAQIEGRVQVHVAVGSAGDLPAASGAELRQRIDDLREVLRTSGLFTAADLGSRPETSWWQLRADAAALQFLIDLPEVTAMKDPMAFRATP